ncbi:MAG: GTP-binding protein [Euryarchaeota archaeon]|nr:GTP-binding protein [Euryarchaeota archaeon]
MRFALYHLKQCGWLMDVKQVKRKVLLIGDGAVGKTSLIRKFVTDRFDDKYITTIGAKITKKDLRYKVQGGDMLLTLMIWDILGQKGYTGVQASSYRGAEGAMIVCDLTRKETLQSTVDYWIPELRKVVGEIPMIFVGNKCDLIDARQISEAELESTAKSFATQSYVSSAKTGENVEALFLKLGEVVLNYTPGGNNRASETAPRTISNLTDVTDIIIQEFCDSFGDQETAMAAIRQQFSLAGVDVKNPQKAPLLKAVERLAEVEKGFKDDFSVKSSLSKRKRLIEQHGG